MNPTALLASAAQRPDPRQPQAALQGADSADVDPTLADSAEEDDDASLLRLIGAVATTLVVLAAAGSLLA